ncbi:MAG: Tol biopolymer transport system component [Bradymonadia bacterium]|jgi:Tol biopolymer transport system component
MTSRLYRQLSLPALVMMLIAPIGCGDSTSGSDSECTTLICPCESNDDCNSGQVCTALGICGQDDAADTTGLDAGADADAEEDVTVPDVTTDVVDDVLPDVPGDVEQDADTEVPDVSDADDADTIDPDVADVETTDVETDADADAETDVEEDADTETDTGPTDPYPVVVPLAENPWVAFIRQASSLTLEQVFITAHDGGEDRQLFADTDYLSTFSPTWSPDGTRLAFIAFTLSAERALVVVDVTTGQPEEFSLAPLTIFENLSWAPVGGEIALNGRSDEDADNEIYLFDVNAETPELVALTDNDTADTYPRWINDGRLAYVSDADGGVEVFTIDTLADGATPIQLTTATGMRGAFGIDPTGELLFYSVASGDGITALRRLNITTGQMQTYTSSPSERDAYVRRDGAGLVFGSGRTGTVQVYRADLAVSDPIAITASTLRASTPCVSPVSGAGVVISDTFVTD